MNNNVPMGANDSPLAPWNEEDRNTSKESKEIEVTISMTLSKTVKIKVKDYETYTDANEEGSYLVYDYRSCDLEKAVKDQVTLPTDINFLSDWNEDEFEVILEE